jgi:hypothetical protein
LEAGRERNVFIKRRLHVGLVLFIDSNRDYERAGILFFALNGIDIISVLDKSYPCYVFSAKRKY